MSKCVMRGACRLRLGYASYFGDSGGGAALGCAVGCGGGGGGFDGPIPTLGELLPHDVTSNASASKAPTSGGGGGGGGGGFDGPIMSQA